MVTTHLYHLDSLTPWTSTALPRRPMLRSPTLIKSYSSFLDYLASRRVSDSQLNRHFRGARVRSKDDLRGYYSTCRGVCDFSWYIVSQCHRVFAGAHSA